LAVTSTQGRIRLTRRVRPLRQLRLLGPEDLEARLSRASARVLSADQAGTSSSSHSTGGRRPVHRRRAVPRDGSPPPPGFSKPASNVLVDVMNEVGVGKDTHRCRPSSFTSYSRSFANKRQRRRLLADRAARGEASRGPWLEVEDFHMPTAMAARRTVARRKIAGSVRRRIP